MGKYMMIAALVLLTLAECAPATAANVEKIVFQSDRDGNYEIYVMNANGSGQTRLTNNSDSDLSPAWSPDGSKIAFTSYRDGNYEIYMMNTDGTGQVDISNNPTSDIEAAWSPDGSKIAFVSGGGLYSFAIYVMNADGTGQTRLTDPVGNRHPTWSQDGSKIAFASFGGAIYVMNADGTGQVVISNANDMNPAWSPDGSKIAFASSRDGNDEIYVMNADGTGQTRLTNNTAWDIAPMWSPDGSKIAFTSNRDGNDEIYVMNADGSGQTRLTDNPAQDVNAAWGVIPDATAPMTSALLDPPSPTGDNGWYSGGVTVTLSAVDPDDAPADIATYHTLDGASNTYATPFPVNEDGTHALLYHSVDVAGRAEVDKSMTFSIDATPPLISISTPLDGASYPLGKTVPADWTADDATSGVVSSSGTVPSGGAIDTGTPGPKAFIVTATDNAGNSASVTVHYNVTSQLATGPVITIDQGPMSGDVTVYENGMPMGIAPGNSASVTPTPTVMPSTSPMPTPTPSEPSPSLSSEPSATSTGSNSMDVGLVIVILAIIVVAAAGAYYLLRKK